MNGLLRVTESRKASSSQRVFCPRYQRRLVCQYERREDGTAVNLGGTAGILPVPCFVGRVFCLSPGERIRYALCILLY